MIQSVHMWGFYDDAGEQPRPYDRAAPSEDTVHGHYERVRGNIERHGGTVEQVHTTRSIGSGYLVGIEFVTPARRHDDGSVKAAKIWHRIITPTEEWPA